MNSVDVSSIRRIKIPEGLDALLEEIIRGVLKIQPKHPELFIADMVKKLIEIRNEAATGSTQASPTDVYKHIMEQERMLEQEVSKQVQISYQKEVSSTTDADPNSEAAERGSVHYVEATAGRTLAASTTDLAILGVTVKYKEPVDYRRSVHSDQGYVCENDRLTRKYEHELSEKDLPDKQLESEAIVNDIIAKANNIVTTATIEKPPSELGPKPVETVIKVQPVRVKTSQIPVSALPEVVVKSAPSTRPEMVEKSAASALPEAVEQKASTVPKVVEKTEASTLPEAVEQKASTVPKVVEKTEASTLPEAVEQKASTVPKVVEKTEASTLPEVVQRNVMLEKEPPKVIQVTKKESVEESDLSPVSETKLKPNPPTQLDKESPDNEISDRTNENSERESTSSEVISIVHKSKDEDEDGSTLPKQTSFETISTRPNRLSLGQHSIESDQNTLEISSADDVVKNESTDLTSPESLRESIEESLAKDTVVSPNADSKGDIESWKSEKDPKEISNTSLNTLGDDSEGHSEFDVEPSKEHKVGIIRRFDTISSNGESSYRPEEHNYPSVTEVPELEEYECGQNFVLDSTNEEVFDQAEEEHRRLKESVRESARIEVDRICEEAIESVTVMINNNAVLTIVTAELADEVNNVSESSVLSVVAEKGSDFDSLSLVDEQSEHSRSNVFSIDENRCQQRIPEVPKVQSRVSSQAEAEKRLQGSNQTSLEDSPISLQEVSGTVISQEDISLNDTEKTTLDSVSEDLPKPPDIEDFPPLPENLDQFDITEDELKAVQLPDSVEAESVFSKNNPIDISAEAAASRIQAGVRGYLTRKQLKDSLRNNSPSERDSFDLDTKNYVKNKRLSLDSKLGDFENIRKLPKLKSTLSECVEEENSNGDYEKAAKKIQSTFRHYRARKSICLGDARGKMINGAAGHSQPTSQTKFELSAKTLNDLQPLMEESRKSPEEVDATAGDSSLEQAAVKIQATYRGFRARKSIQLSASAATKIQAHFRGYKVRKNFKRSSSLNDLRNSASSSCSNLSSQPELEKHVTRIQAGVRGYLVRKRHSLQNVAAAKIQINYRKYKSRKESKSKN